MLKFFHNDWDETGREMLNELQNHNLHHWECDKYFASMLNERVFHIALIIRKPENTCELRSIADWKPITSSPLDKKQRRALRDMHIYTVFQWIFEKLEFDSTFSYIKEEPKVRRILTDINGGSVETTKTITKSGIPLLRWEYTKKEFENGILYRKMQKSVHDL